MNSFLRPAAIALAALTLAACAGWEPKIAPLENYQPESFGANAYARHYAAAPARTCEAARRALLSQGYVVTGAAGEQVSGRKYFQPDSYHHVQLEFRVVCAPERTDSNASMAFVSGLKEQYLVRKVKDSASLGVGGIGSLSLPIEGNLDSMVKVSSETVTDPKLYERLFALLGEHLEHAIVPPPPVAPASAPAPAPAPVIVFVPAAPFAPTPAAPASAPVPATEPASAAAP
jgi:hypothetical protein